MTEEDYEIKSHAAVLSATLLPAEKLTVTLTGSYTDSTGELDSLNFPAPSAGLAAASYGYDFTGVHEYSNLDIEQWGLDVDSEYQITPQLTLGIGGSIHLYQDNDPYLFDESGTLYLAQASLNYIF